MPVPPSLSSQRLRTTLLWAPTAPAQVLQMKSQLTLWLKGRTSVPSSTCLGVTLARGHMADTAAG